MRTLFALILCCLLFTACTGQPAETSKPTQPTEVPETTLEAVISTSAPEMETEVVEMIRMTVYYPDDNAISFLTTTLEGEQLTFLDAMIEVGVLNEAITVNTIIREDSNLTIDFNAAFRDLVCTMGTSGERMIIGSVVNTLIEHYKVETVSITVEGDIWESGHVIYDFPMGFFE